MVARGLVGWGHGERLVKRYIIFKIVEVSETCPMLTLVAYLFFLPLPVQRNDNAITAKLKNYICSEAL